MGDSPVTIGVAGCGVTGTGISEPEGCELPGAGGAGPGVSAVVLSLFAPLCEGVLSASGLPRVGASLDSIGCGVEDLPLGPTGLLVVRGGGMSVGSI